MARIHLKTIMMKLTEKDKRDRPREKLVAKGAAALTDLELLAALIGSGNAQRDVLTIAADVRALLREAKAQGFLVNYPALSAVPGMGTAKICELLAAFELARRYLPPQTSTPVVLDTPDKIVAQFADIRNKQQEHFVVLTLDGACRLIARRTVFIGTLNASLVHPREVFADAITDRAASVIVGHNHPSGSIDPSPADQEVTRSSFSDILRDETTATAQLQSAFATIGYVL